MKIKLKIKEYKIIKVINEEGKIEKFTGTNEDFIGSHKIIHTLENLKNNKTLSLGSHVHLSDSMHDITSMVIKNDFIEILA